MSKSTLDIVIRTVQQGFMSAHEVRQQLELDGLNGAEVGHLERAPHVDKIKCEYCGRPNAHDVEQCASCGGNIPIK